MSQKTLEELVAENIQLNDKRRKAFKELKRRIKDEVLPKLVDVLKASDKPHTCIKLDNLPFGGCSRCYADTHDFFYAIYITEDSMVVEGYQDRDEFGNLRCYKSRYVEPISFDEFMSIIDCDAVLELYNKVNRKIVAINERIANEIHNIELALDTKFD